MDIVISKKSHRVQFKNTSVLATIDPLYLIKFFKVDMLNALKKNVGLSKDVDIEFPMFGVSFDSEEKFFCLLDKKHLDNPIDYTIAFRHMKASKETRKTIRKYKLKA